MVPTEWVGSGTTMIAAFLEGRRFFGSELMHKFFKMAVQRFRGAQKVSKTA